jgi:hypothetical protein
MSTAERSAASRERLMATPLTLPNMGERLVSNGTLAGGRGTHTATSTSVPMSRSVRYRRRSPTQTRPDRS